MGMFDSLHSMRHSKEDALNNREFEHLLAGARELDEYESLQARFVIFMAGRLGMRRGEIAHITREWVDWNRNMICIPYHERCIKGRQTMDICGDCRLKAKQRADHNPELSVKKAEEMQWVAKTPEAAREIPFDHKATSSVSIR